MDRISLVVVLSALVILAVACGGKGASSPASQSPTAVVETPSPTTTPTPSPTAEPTPTPIPTVEPPSANPVPGSCLILEQKYCDKGFLIYWQGWPFLAFRLPTDVSLFAPFSGKVERSATSLINPEATALVMYLDFEGNDIADEGDIEFGVVGDLTAAVGEVNQGVITELDGITIVGSYFLAQQGAVIATISEKGITALEDYNVVVSFSVYEAGRKMFIPNESLLRQYFNP